MMRFAVAVVVTLALLAPVAPVSASGAGAAPSPLGEINPIQLLEQAGALLPGGGGNGGPAITPAGPQPTEGAVPGEPPASTSQGLSTTLNILLLLTVLSLAPALLVLCTCFTRVVIVLGLLRQALGTQTLPPSQVIVGLSLFITFAVMGPTLQRMYTDGIEPYTTGEIKDYKEAWELARQPLRDYMFTQIEVTENWSGVYMMLNYRGVDTSDPASLTRADVDMLTLVPAYVLCELKTAFLMGFRIYLPFLVIDMVIASMLISMGMLMLPPVLISLPFKLLLFVLVDGWQLVVESLLASVAQPEQALAVASVAVGGVP